MVVVVIVGIALSSIIERSYQKWMVCLLLCAAGTIVGEGLFE